MENKHTTREAWLNAAVTELKQYVFGNYTVCDEIRSSCGFPSSRALSAKHKRIGECWDKEASTDNHFEVLISPLVDDPKKVLAVLTHELVHVLAGHKAGHKGPFRKIAKDVNLEGKMTATVASDRLNGVFETTILPLLGAYPHSAISPNSRPKKKDGTRMIKLECHDCGYIVRTTQKWIETGVPTCTCGGSFSA